MLIDDNRIVVDLLQTLLEIEGFVVIDNPINGDILAAILQEKPAVILMDVFLNVSSEHEKDGLVLLQNIRAHPDLADVKVVMSSGIDFSEESRRYSADGFIHKPYMPEDLIRLIYQVLE